MAITRNGVINMIISKLHLPLKDNNGGDLDFLHSSLTANLVNTFNGCTITKGVGAWMDNGVTYNEPIAIYEVAMWGAKYKTAQFVKIAHEFGALAGQIAVYYSIDGRPMIDDIVPQYTTQKRPSANNPKGGN